VAAQAGPGKTVAVVGDGAVGLLGVLAAKQLGAERIIAMSCHRSRQQLAVEFGATDIVEERGDEGVDRIKDMTGRVGRSLGDRSGRHPGIDDAGHPRRPPGHVGYVGVSHDVALPGEELFFSHVHLHGGPAPVRRFLPHLMDLIWNRDMNCAIALRGATADTYPPCWRGSTATRGLMSAAGVGHHRGPVAADPPPIRHPQIRTAATSVIGTPPAKINEPRPGSGPG